MNAFDIAEKFLAVGFCATCLTSFFFIYLTLFHIKKVTGTYKKMVIFFAGWGVFFSGWELIARPFAHNYNNAVIVMSVNTWIPSHCLLQILSALWILFYLAIICLIAVQFVYRYLCLFDPKKSEKFDGYGFIAWISYPFLAPSVHCISFFFFVDKDEKSDEYVR